MAISILVEKKVNCEFDLLVFFSIAHLYSFKERKKLIMLELRGWKGRERIERIVHAPLSLVRTNFIQLGAICGQWWPLPSIILSKTRKQGSGPDES